MKLYQQEVQRIKEETTEGRILFGTAGRTCQSEDQYVGTRLNDSLHFGEYQEEQRGENVRHYSRWE